jgi:hypothetical protein
MKIIRYVRTILEYAVIIPAAFCMALYDLLKDPCSPIYPLLILLSGLAALLWLAFNIEAGNITNFSLN